MLNGEVTTVDQKPRAFTAKSIFFGVLGICIVSGLAGFHDYMMFGSPLMVGSHLPVGAFFFILLVALGWNLAWSRALPALVLSPRELMVVMGMTLMACYPPTSGLCRYFQRQLVLPWYYLSAGGKTEWEAFGILDYLPRKLFPQPAPVMQDGLLQLDPTVYRGFFTGLVQGRETVGLSGLPWRGWIQPLLYWGPLVILMSVCVTALSLFVHQQWAHHEQLSYPLAQVGSAFLQRANGRGVPDLFRSRLFWFGFAPIFLLYTLEYLHQSSPVTVPGISTILPNLKHWSLPGLQAKIPILSKSEFGGWISSQTMYFSVIGIAFFVSAEIALTMGLCTILLVVISLWFFMVSGTPLLYADVRTGRMGAYVGYALILLYTGRTYYLAVLKKAFGFGKPLEHEWAGILAARIVMLSSVGFVLMLIAMGLDWMIAIFFSLALMLLFLVFTRIICETGIPLLQADWFPGGLLTTFLGPAAMGPGPLVFVLYLGTVLCSDARECLMPYAATSIRMADDANVRITKIFWVLTAAVVVALVVGFASTSWTMYNFGGMAMDEHAYRRVPTECFDNAAREISDLQATGMLEQSAQLHGLARLKLLAPDRSAMKYLLAGIAAVFVFSALRFRMACFPLHPVLFLVWGTWPARHCWASFLVGWAIKVLVVRFGGGKAYQKLKPLFVGIIAGELIAVGASIFVELVTYWITGEVPQVRFVNIMVE